MWSIKFICVWQLQSIVLYPKEKLETLVNTLVIGENPIPTNFILLEHDYLQHE